MKQPERRDFLIEYLIRENKEFRGVQVPDTEHDKRALLRALLNLRPAGYASSEFIRAQNEYLKVETERKGIVDYRDIPEIRPGYRLWKGDITALRCDAIVNAASSGMTGCYRPCHDCVDNRIHTFAGVQLRRECDELMRRQAHPETVGQAKVTKGYNLPARYVMHTLGPTVSERLNDTHKELLSSCYESCLRAADARNLKGIAFSCISTGEFRFPHRAAAWTAVQAVEKYRKDNGSGIDVVFCVQSEEDEALYREVLTSDQLQPSERKR